jgi:peptidoglycan/LPS O-acetylase OafA/YrhL
MDAEKQRLGAIDGLRGLAVIATALLHWVIQPTAGLFSEGVENLLVLTAYGVDLFFVISGFLIGGILLRVQKNLAGIRAFYIRRILRIWPPYYLLLLLVYLLVRGSFSKAPWWSFPLFIFNFWGGRGEAIHPSLYHLWSIAVEEQFYIVGPILFSIVADKKRLAKIFAAYLCAAPFIRLALALFTKIETWEFTPARLDGICVGLLLAIIVSSPDHIAYIQQRLKLFQNIALSALAAVIPARMLLPNLYWFSFGNSLMVIVFGVVLMVTYIECISDRENRLLNFGALRYLGVRCYSIYLFHLPFLYIAYALFDSYAVQLAFQFALTLIFAHISWNYLEAPFIKLGQRFSYENVIASNAKQSPSKSGIASGKPPSQ